MRHPPRILHTLFPRSQAHFLPFLKAFFVNPVTFCLRNYVANWTCPGVTSFLRPFYFPHRSPRCLCRTQSDFLFLLFSSFRFSHQLSLPRLSSARTQAPFSRYPLRFLVRLSIGLVALYSDDVLSFPPFFVSPRTAQALRPAGGPPILSLTF